MSKRHNYRGFIIYSSKGAVSVSVHSGWHNVWTIIDRRQDDTNGDVWDFAPTLGRAKELVNEYLAGQGGNR